MKLELGERVKLGCRGVLHREFFRGKSLSMDTWLFLLEQLFDAIRDGMLGYNMSIRGEVGYT
jgi:hypothetical protein